MSSRFETVVPISELQTSSRALVDQVRKTGIPIVVTQRGRPAAMLVNYDLYEGHLATLDETSFPDWEEKLGKAQREIADQQLIPHDEVIAGRKRRRRRS
jgi:prevent-host-death family protein